MGAKWKLAAALVAAGVVGSAGVAQAQAVTFIGNTFGCFYTGIFSGSCTSTTDTFGGLVYNNSTFNLSSNAADGQLTIGDTPTPPANFNNLGSFTLNGGGVDYTGQKFALVIDFSAPPGSMANAYSAMLTGNLVGSSSGNVSIDFDNTPQMFSFTGGTKLSFHVNDLSLNDTRSTAIVAVTGVGQVTTTPEPASMVLLGTGLIGIFGAVRSRRKNTEA